MGLLNFDTIPLIWAQKKMLFYSTTQVHILNGQNKVIFLAQINGIVLKFDNRIYVTIITYFGNPLFTSFEANSAAIGT